MCASVESTQRSSALQLNTSTSPALAAGVMDRLFDVSDLVKLLIESESKQAAQRSSAACGIIGPTGGPMRRLLLKVVAAVLFFGLGWLAAHMAAGPQGAFKLTIDAPAGQTMLKCEGCQFLTWTADGHADQRQPVINFSCGNAPCRKAFGAVAITQEPKLIAGLKASAAP